MGAFSTIIKSPEGAIGLGVGAAAVVVGIYSKNVPAMADIHSAPAHNDQVEGSRRKAAWESAVFLGAVYLISRDWRALIIAGATLAGTDIMVKHGNGISHLTGQLEGSVPRPQGPAAPDGGTAAGASAVQDLSYGYPDDGAGGY